MSYQNNKRLLAEIITFYNGEAFVERQLSQTDEITSIEFSENYLAFSYNRGLEGFVSILDLETMEERFTYKHSSRILKIAFPPDEFYLLIQDDNKKFYEFYFDLNESVYAFKAKSEVNSIAFKQNMPHLATGQFGNHPHILDIENETKLLHKLYDGADSSPTVTFSSDGKYLAYGNSNSEIVVYDANTYSLISKLNSGNTGGIDLISFSTDSSKIISVSKDPFIRIWDIGTMRLVEKVRMANFGVNAIFYASENGFLLASFMNKPLVIWDLLKSKLYNDIYKATSASDFANTSGMARFSRDGRYLAMACGFGSSKKSIKVYIANLPPNYNEIVEKYANKLNTAEHGNRSNYGVSDPQNMPDFF